MSAECSAENILPGYKKTEVGVISEDWNVCLLDSVANRGSGHTPDKSHPEYWGGNIKWISLQDSDRLDKLYIYDTAAKITPLGIKNSSAKMHLEGTVVLSRDAGVGKSAIMKEDMAVSQHFIAWKCGPLLNNHFLYYWLQSNKSEFERIAMGNTIKTIGLPYFRRLSIPLPTIVEQEAIAESLSDTDAFIESLEQLIAKKRQIKQGAMQELLTGKRRLPGFGEGKGYKQTEVGVIPEDWSAVDYISFGQVIDGDRGVHYPSAFDLQDTGYCLFLNAGNVTKEGFRFSECQFISTEKDKKLNKGKLSRGDVILTTRGTLGNFAYYTKRVPFEHIRINSGMVILRNTAETVTNTYQYLVLRSQMVESQIERLSFGSAQPQLTVKGISTLKIPLPPTKSEQEAIATILSDMDSEISALEEKLAKARQIKQSMMQELLTGKIRLI